MHDSISWNLHLIPVNTRLAATWNIHAGIPGDRIFDCLNGIDCWTNSESFDRDMPIDFLPIKWEKLRLKLKAAEEAGIRNAITFEFSHFISPNSMYRSAGELFDRYCEENGIPARARDFRQHW